MSTGNPTRTMPERLLSVREVANTLNVSERQVRRWTASGNIEVYKLGGRVRIAPAALRRFLHEHVESEKTGIPCLDMSK